VGRRQAQFRPNLQGGTGDAFATRDVLLVGLVVVEEVEFNEFDALVFQVEQGA
jgi:hypothetical protein